MRILLLTGVNKEIIMNAAVKSATEQGVKEYGTGYLRYLQILSGKR